MRTRVEKSGCLFRPHLDEACALASSGAQCCSYCTGLVMF